MTGKVFRPGDPVFDAPRDESESERALGIELSGGGWAALLGVEDVDEDWDGESESAKRAQRFESGSGGDAESKRQVLEGGKPEQCGVSNEGMPHLQRVHPLPDSLSLDAQRAQSRLDRDAKAASDRVVAAVSRSKLAEADCGHLAARDHHCATCSLCLGCCECENFGDHYLQRGSITWRTWCAEHGDWHSAPSLEELRALIRQMHRNEDAEVGEDFSRAAREDDR